MQLEEGEVANTFAYEDAYKTLEKCQRFYETGTNTMTLIHNGSSVLSGVFKNVSMKRTKRISPNITVRAEDFSGAPSTNPPDLNVIRVDDRKFAMSVNVGATKGATAITRVKVKWIADSELPLYNTENGKTTIICADETACQVAGNCPTNIEVGCGITSRAAVTDRTASLTRYIAEIPDSTYDATFAGDNIKMAHIFRGNVVESDGSAGYISVTGPGSLAENYNLSMVFNTNALDQRSFTDYELFLLDFEIPFISRLTPTDPVKTNLNYVHQDGSTYSSTVENMKTVLDWVHDQTEFGGYPVAFTNLPSTDLYARPIMPEGVLHSSLNGTQRSELIAYHTDRIAPLMAKQDFCNVSVVPAHSSAAYGDGSYGNINSVSAPNTGSDYYSYFAMSVNNVSVPWAGLIAEYDAWQQHMKDRLESAKSHGKTVIASINLTYGGGSEFIGNQDDYTGFKYLSMCNPNCGGDGSCYEKWRCWKFFMSKEDFFGRQVKFAMENGVHSYVLSWNPQEWLTVACSATLANPNYTDMDGSPSAISQQNYNYQYNMRKALQYAFLNNIDPTGVGGANPSWNNYVLMRYLKRLLTSRASYYMDQISTFYSDGNDSGISEWTSPADSTALLSVSNGILPA